MAIAFFVPPEYGPPQNQQQAQQQQQAQNNNQNNNQNNQADGGGGGDDPPIVDLHREHFHQDANNNNVMRRHNEQQPRQAQNNHSQLVALFTGFVHELLTVFGNRQNHNNNNTTAAGGENNHQADNNVVHGQAGGQQQRAEQSIRMRRHAAPDLPNIQIHQQDNQPPPAANLLPDLIPSGFRSLPDIVSCHAGMSFRYNSSSSPASSSQSVNQDNRLDIQSSNLAPHSDRLPVAPLSPASSQHHPPSTSVDFEVSLKLEMSVSQEQEESMQQELEDMDEVPASSEDLYRLAGRQLRAIADSFERSHNSHRRALRPSTQSTFELKIVISVAVPTVALVGLGLAYLRRR